MNSVCCSLLFFAALLICVCYLAIVVWSVLSKNARKCCVDTEYYSGSIFVQSFISESHRYEFLDQYNQIFDINLISYENITSFGIDILIGSASIDSCAYERLESYTYRLKPSTWSKLVNGSAYLHIIGTLTFAKQEPIAFRDYVKISAIVPSKNSETRNLLSDLGFPQNDSTQRLKSTSTALKSSVKVTILDNESLQLAYSNNQLRPDLFDFPVMTVDFDQPDSYSEVNSSTCSIPFSISFSHTSLQRLYFSRGLQISAPSFDIATGLTSDISPPLLVFAGVVSVLHLIFEFQAMRSEIRFWNQRESITGISVHFVRFEMISQLVIGLYLVQSNASMLVVCSSFVASVVQLWKIWKASSIVNVLQQTSAQYAIHSIFQDTSRKADKFAALLVIYTMIPLGLGILLRSLVYEEHVSWYSFAVSTAATSMYCAGFLFLLPQLYINYKLKSVSSMPWGFLMYKFLNTIIDDIFVFLVRTPFMHKVFVFRDDIVFLIYLYQRWIYRVDVLRQME